MKKILLVSFSLLLFVGLFAQWSTDPQSPNLVAGNTGEQVMPKVAVTNSGNTYVCRFDNSGGSYYVYVQLFSADGTPVWTVPAGILVSNHTQMTWLTEYDITADNDGNVVIVFQDIRNAGVNNVVAYKISSTGEFLWGADGIALSSDTGTDYSNMSPVVFNSSDNSTYAAWQRMGSNTMIMMNRLSSTGAKLWGENGITINSIDGSCTWPQIIQGEGDNVLLKYYLDSGPFWAPTRHVYVAKYNTSGVREWNALMSDAGGISAWTQLLPFESDGAGGGILAWYEDREVDNDEDVYCQRVNATGTTTMPDDGALITQDPVNQQYYPELAVDTVNQYIYAFYKVTDANQNLCGMGRQLLDYNGNRQWGDTAPLFIDISSAYASTVASYYTSRGAVCYYAYGSDMLYATCWRSSGNQGWNDQVTEIASLPDTRYHFDMDSHPDEWSILVWEQGTADMDIYAMRLNNDGSLGMQYPAPRGLTATLVPPDDITLTWQEPSQYLLPDSYDIYMNGSLLLSSAGNVWTVQLMNLAPGTYNFYVIAIYPGGHSSAPSETATVSVVSNDDELAPLLSTLPRLEPNPFQSSADLTFTLNRPVSKGIISVFNLKGQKLFEQSFNATAGSHSYPLQADMFSSSGNGVYLIRLQFDGEIRTLKAIHMQ